MTSNSLDGTSPIHPTLTLRSLVTPEGPSVKGYPLLTDYARALLAMEDDSVRFLWQADDGTWLRVQINRCEEGALLEACAIDLPMGLTAREIDVLSLVTMGLSNRDIAEGLSLSARTVSTHVEHILVKMAEESRSGAAAVAAARGLVRLPIPGIALTSTNLTVAALHAEVSGVAGYPRATRRHAVVPPHLVLGSIVALSGPASADGREMLDGSTLAINELNASGGIGGRLIEHVVVDTDIFSAEDVERAFITLADAGASAIISGYVFEEDAAREAAALYGCPYLHSMTSESQARIVADNPSRYAGIFQVCPTESHYAISFLRFIADLKERGRWRERSNRVAFLDTALASGAMVTDDALRVAEQLGLEVVVTETVPAAGADWRHLVQCLIDRDVAAVMIAQFLAGELATFQRELSRRASHILVFAVYAPSIPEFLELAGPAAEGIVWTTVTGTYSDSIARSFVQEFRRLTGHSPGRSQAGLAYDSVHLVARAWARASDPTDFQRVAELLRHGRYRGVNGAYSLDNPAQSALNYPYTTPDPSLGQAHLIFQVQDGRHRIIGPAPYADATVRC